MTDSILRKLTRLEQRFQELRDRAEVSSDGVIHPVSLADSAADNNTIYYSTDASRLVYKDSSGTVNNLY